MAHVQMLCYLLTYQEGTKARVGKGVCVNMLHFVRTSFMGGPARFSHKQQNSYLWQKW